jgi:TolA-binding protein
MGSALSTVNQTTWLGEAMLPWLRTHKSAEGPALLVKLVYASRHGEPDTATSRAAFQLLHQQYPTSPEAQRTRYYF